MCELHYDDDDYAACDASSYYHCREGVYDDRETDTKRRHCLYFKISIFLCICLFVLGHTVDWDKKLSFLCEVVYQYALQWAKRETVELSVLSSWKEMVNGQIEGRVSKLKQNFKHPLARCCKMLM